MAPSSTSSAERTQQLRDKMKRYTARVKRQRLALSAVHNEIQRVVGSLEPQEAEVFRQGTRSLLKTKALMYSQDDSSQHSSQMQALVSTAEKLNYQKRASKACMRASEGMQIEFLGDRGFRTLPNAYGASHSNRGHRSEDHRSSDAAEK